MPATTLNQYGIKALRRIQLAKEATPGTGLIATTMWRGEGTLQDDTAVISPTEDIGVMMGTDRVYIPSQGATLTLQPTPATFEQGPYLGEMGIKSLATGVADGAGSGKIYNYPFPTTTQQSINNYTIESGDNAGITIAPYAMAESIKIAGQYNKAITMEAVIKTRTAAKNVLTASTIAFDNAHHITDSANGLAIFTIGMLIRANGTSLNNGTFTVTASAAGSLTVTETTATEAAGTSFTLEQTFTAVAIPAVHDMVFNQSKLYIDAVGGTIGTTQITGTFLDFEWDYKTGWKGQPAGDGRKDFSFSKSTLPSGVLKITFEHENASKTEKAKWLAGTPSLIRIKNEGIALTSAGTTYSVYTMILDIVGVYTKFNALSNDNGDDTVKAEFKHTYDTTAASAGRLLFVNQLASLT